MNEDIKIATIMIAVEAELRRAVKLHGPMKSFHEGYAVILEELDELWDEVKMQVPDTEKLHKEAIHVAAMASRFMVDLL